MISLFEEVDEDDCPGTGRCHGCAKWCDRCGDVDDVCGDSSGECQQHHCVKCKKRLASAEQDRAYEQGGWEKWCFDCEVAWTMQDAIRRDVDEVDAVLPVLEDIRRYEVTRWETPL